MAVKIMYLMDDYRGPRAGTEGQLLQLLRHLDRSRYEPAITFLRGAEYALRNPFPCPVTVLGITKLASIRAIVGMLRFAYGLRREGYRLVHCFFNDASLIAPFFLKLAGLRVLVSRRDMGLWYSPGVLFILRRVALFVDRFVANSRSVGRHVHAQERVPGDKIAVIYNGYEPYQGAAGLQSAAASIPGVPDGAPVVGIVANLRPIKRIDMLVEAFAGIGERFPDARLVIVGDCSSQQAADTMRNLEGMAQRLGIRERIIFTGQVDEPMKYIERFTVAVLCSESEGFSNSIIEYLQAGRPVVCTATGGNPEIVRDGHNGFLVPVGDAAALAERLVRLLSDDALARRLGAAGREIVSSYTQARMVTEQMACYDDVLAGRTSAA
jgi:glycosyltransferase involved in cell wall biosynthesis